MVTVDDLCASPKQIVARVPDDETRLVLAIHRQSADLGAIQSTARQLGLDPIGVGTVDLDAVTSTEQASLACESVVARVSHYAGSVPEQVKLLPSQRNTRRAFLSVGAPVYVGAPMIDESLCVAAAGCKVCVTECPVGALSSSGGAMAYDVNTCVACGVCVTTCPTGAIRNPSVDPSALEAEIETAVTHSPDPIGIRYRCRDSTVPGEAGWYQVEVPCTGMLTVGWLLAPLVLGATRIDATSCGAGGCGLGNDERLETTMTDARRALETLSTNVAEIAERSNAPSGAGWFAHGSTSRVLAAIAPTQTGLSMTFDVADVGMVSIDSSTCTACEMCAQVCPTDALSSNIDGIGVHISFDPQVCVACGQCVATCPEAEHDAIELTRRFDAAEWMHGRREVRSEPTSLCEVCGQPVAPAAMLSRIEEMLGEDAVQTMALIGRRCVGCRGR